MLNVQAMEYLGAHRLWLRFNNGAEGEVDLAAHLGGPSSCRSATPRWCGRRLASPGGWR
jgi:hypothetical protein